MTSTDKTTLKSYFNTGDILIEAQFHALIDSFPRSYDPVDYGAVGDGVTDDTVAVQAAIDAASVTGGSVTLNGRAYRVTVQGTVYAGMYHADYALWVNADNVFVVGPGTIRVTEVQSITYGFNMLLFGNGGSLTVHTAPLEAGTWTENVGVFGVRFETVGITHDDLNSMWGIESGMVNFAYCRNFFVSNCSFYDTFGYGTIRSHSSSRNGFITHNFMTSTQMQHNNGGVSCDGGRYISVIGNIIENQTVAVVFQSNLDNKSSGYSYYNIVNDNIFLSCYSFLGLTGSSYNSITGNYIYGGIGINLSSYSHASNGEMESSYNNISGNFYYKPNTGGTFLTLAGQNTSLYDGNPLPVQGNLITGNFIDGHFTTLVSFGEQSNSNYIYNNIWDTPGTFTADDATPSVTGFDIWKTANANATTITMLDNGYVGQRVTVIVNDALTTVDFSGTHLKGNGGADWSPGAGDFMTCTFDGTDWYCQVVDTTA